MRRWLRRCGRRILHELLRHEKVRIAVYRVACEIAYYPYYWMLVTVLLLWISEGVSMQSGWQACPRP